MNPSPDDQNFIRYQKEKMVRNFIAARRTVVKQVNTHSVLEEQIAALYALYTYSCYN